jgi:uncharacterized protein (TIGR04255 family)
MSINEVFPNPLVKTVIFQIRFPNLFYLEDKIGDFQIRIMDRFTESSLIMEKQFFFGFGAQPDLEIQNKKNTNQVDRKTWQFKDKEGVILNVYADSLSITSKSHKTYNNPHSEYKFRDIIKFVVDNFIEVVKIPFISRIGFRYIDEMPMEEISNEKFQNYFHTAFNLNRFEISQASFMEFKTKIAKDSFSFNYAEKVENKNDKWIIILDFDAFTNNIKTADYIEVTDKLHQINSDEFEIVIKQPVYEYMRT